MRIMYSAAALNRMLGAHAARTGERIPPEPTAANTLTISQYTMASTMPIPTPYRAPRRPVLTAKGTARSVMTTVTKGKATLRCSDTIYGITLNPPALSFAA